MDNKQFWNRYPNMPFNPRPFRTQPPGEEQAAVPASAVQAPFSPEQGAASDYALVFINNNIDEVMDNDEFSGIGGLMCYRNGEIVGGKTSFASAELHL